MRPKKIILVVNGNEHERSVIAFMLSTNGYRVLAAASGSEAAQFLSENAVDLVLADDGMPNFNGGQIVARLKEITSHVPMILLCDPARVSGQPHAADAVLPRRNCSPIELLERIKNMSARKRGPRKGSTHVVHPQHSLAVAS
jgi:two-component system, OmpR family, response regulator CpxR